MAQDGGLRTNAAQDSPSGQQLCYPEWMGPNLFIWMAIGVVIASTIPAFFGYDWAVWVGYPLAVVLAIFNKVRAVRRRRAEVSRTFD